MTHHRDLRLHAQCGTPRKPKCVRGLTVRRGGLGLRCGGAGSSAVSTAGRSRRRLSRPRTARRERIAAETYQPRRHEHRRHEAERMQTRRHSQRLRRVAQKIHDPEGPTATENGRAERRATQFVRSHRPQHDIAHPRKPGRKTDVILDTIHRRAPPCALVAGRTLMELRYGKLASIRDRTRLSLAALLHR